MTKRSIGKEIIKGLEEIKAWKRGEVFKSAAPGPRKRAFSKARSTSKLFRFPKAA
jgi:hypothetical protein